ncbi:DUF4856 domain-containing protein [uncultured Polaribacter sp.]|uniref:DUF4856 domain-containing protein n=1 Tax=uncultured Polaribacter sp. TaxID=174711 RepID=UPI002753241B|nr:DUF4856 domain-containing protein [Polaribacter sp.]|tara:strand:- start:12971 stop:14161 length:1191 start_codon:yes stop_codon:yes gene_type:complete
MRKPILVIAIATLAFISCNNSDLENINLEVPETYNFNRNGNSTVDFNGQTTRILMAEAFGAALKENTKTENELSNMFAHNQGDTNFLDANLNASDKNIRSKVAASTDYFLTNSTASNAIKADFDGWISNQVSEVFPNWNSIASQGVAGQIQQSGGGTIRYVNAKGMEYDQLIKKGLLGALMIDQILNNYLSPAVLDEASNQEENDNEVLVSGKNYTNMEHKWDEGFGYLYGNEVNIEAPVLDVDSFLSEYLERVNGNSNFSTFASDIYNAFKKGRAAIVQKNYIVRNEQADIIKEKISLIPAVRAVYYLQASKANLGIDNARAFHALSEAYGFIYSLQFTRNPSSNVPYVTKAEVDNYLVQLSSGNGFWDISETTIDEISTAIASKFNFTVSQFID